MVQKLWPMLNFFWSRSQSSSRSHVKIFCVIVKLLSQGIYMPNMKALSQLVQKLWPMLKFSNKQTNQQTDRAKTICPRYCYRGHKKAKVVILVYDMSSGPVLHYYQVSLKYSNESSTYIADTKSMHNQCQIYQKEITAKVRKAELSFLLGTHCTVLFYSSTRYHQNILKGIPFTEQTRNLFQTKQRKTTPKVRKRELSFLYATGRLVLFYISTKYHKNIPKGFWLKEWTQNQWIITVKHKKGR